MPMQIPKATSALPAPLHAQAADFLAKLPSKDRSELEALFSALYESSRLRTVSDVWECDEAPWTYWILLMSGSDQPDERRIAKELLEWQAFSAKSACKVMCIPSSEHDAFGICSRAFGSDEFPTLILGLSPGMESFIRLTPSLLAHLSQTDGALQKFFTRIHWKILHGGNLATIRDLLTQKAFWKGIKIVYDEIKGFLSISISTGG